MSTPARELVIVGAGPAGVSAALWARARHLDVSLLEAGPGPGGQLLLVHFQPREILGWLAGDGVALAAAAGQQLAEAGIPVRYGARVEALERADGLALRLAGEERVRAAAVLVATGARRRRLDVPGESEFEGRGISYSATRDLDWLAGRAVVVVGGGDAAFENAALLASRGSTVTVLARAAARARAEFRERVEHEPRVRLIEHARVLALLGEERVRAVRASGPDGEWEIACDAVVVKVGVLPNTEWCRDVLAHDEAGYLRVHDGLETSVPGVWAAGDVVRPLLFGVPVAAGHGALAAAAIRRALRGS